MRIRLDIHLVALLLAGVPWIVEAQTAGGVARLGLARTTPNQNFLYQSGRPYANHAFEDWIYPEILSRGPYRNYYGPLGDYVFTGFDIFSWRETRTTEHLGEVETSEIRKQGFGIFEETVMVSETYADWRAKLIIAEELRSAFTPLTLTLAALNGVRLDAETRHTRFSVLASRFGEPVYTNSLERFSELGQAN